MNKNRMEAFSDGVLAIIITIMVLEFKTPESSDIEAFQPLIPTFLSYILSFIYLGIYWNNHHHLLHTVNQINGKILWANLHLLFWLSLIPFVTAANGENNFAPFTMMLYGAVLLCCAMSYFILQGQIIKLQGENSILAKAIGKDYKGKTSLSLYIIAVIFSNFLPIISGAIYILVALMWLVPDKRIERIFKNNK